MFAECVQQAKTSDEENLYLVGQAADVDAINGRFYGNFPYPWRPLNFLYPASGTLAGAMLNQSAGEAALAGAAEAGEGAGDATGAGESTGAGTVVVERPPSSGSIDICAALGGMSECAEALKVPR